MATPATLIARRRRVNRDARPRDGPHTVAFRLGLLVGRHRDRDRDRGRFGWAERLPTWCRRRGRVSRAHGLVMEGAVDRLPRLAFIIPLLVLHLTFVSGVHWTLALAVAWDYLWFVPNPACTVHRFRAGQIW